MKNNFKFTMGSCFLSYITSAVIVNFIPLLFVKFQTDYALSASKLALLVTVNFIVQLTVDLLGAKYVDRIGYRPAMVAANILAAVGLIFLAFLPSVLSVPYLGILISVIVFAIGGGMLEVLVSPIIDAIPTETNNMRMSLLHSVYCFGHGAVVLFSTVLFKLLGIDNWRILSLIWAVIPAVSAILFLFCPIVSQQGDEKKSTLPKLLKIPFFWMFIFMMLCSGAAEQGLAQWASYFAEKSLNISKSTGDLLGPCLFAVLMGAVRVIYGIIGKNLKAEKYLLISGLVGFCGYILSSVSNIPLFSLIGCGLCGVGVAIMWPGLIDLSKKYCTVGGTAMFALLAFGGDIGCFIGPQTVAVVSDLSGGNIGAGFAVSTVFPLCIVAGMTFLILLNRRKTNIEIQ